MEQNCLTLRRVCTHSRFDLFHWTEWLVRRRTERGPADRTESVYWAHTHFGAKGWLSRLSELTELTEGRESAQCGSWHFLSFIRRKENDKSRFKDKRMQHSKVAEYCLNFGLFCIFFLSSVKGEKARSRTEESDWGNRAEESSWRIGPRSRKMLERSLSCQTAVPTWEHPASRHCSDAQDSGPGLIALIKFALDEAKLGKESYFQPFCPLMHSQSR